MVKRGLRLFTSIIVLVCVLISSCGIDTLSYLKSDHEPISISSGSKALVFTGPEATDGSYIGISICYRIYASSDNAESDKSYITTKQNTDNAVPGELVNSYIISGLNYLSVVFDGKKNQPLLPDSVINSKLLTINFNNSEPVLTINDGSVETEYSLKRYKIDGEDSVSFNTEPQSGNLDYKTSSSDTDNDYYVQFYAYSYGLDGLTPAYSDAVWLGLITLNFQD